MYLYFALDSPADLTFLADNFEMILSGVNISSPIISKSLPFMALAARTDNCWLTIEDTRA